jgi:hypothetical protein
MTHGSPAVVIARPFDEDQQCVLHGVARFVGAEARRSRHAEQRRHVLSRHALHCVRITSLDGGGVVR